jgi:hypothetical protein
MLERERERERGGARRRREGKSKEEARSNALGVEAVPGPGLTNVADFSEIQ